MWQIYARFCHDTLICVPRSYLRSTSPMVDTHTHSSEANTQFVLKVLSRGYTPADFIDPKSAITQITAFYRLRRVESKAQRKQRKKLEAESFNEIQEEEGKALVVELENLE
jgi:hypothetical protein